MDDAGVSEVVGAILSFAIISILVVVAVNGFQRAAEIAVDEAIEQEADAVAQTVAARIGDLALWAEKQTGQTAVYASPLGLPRTLEGHEYRVYVLGNGNVTVDVEGDSTIRTRVAPGISGLTSHSLCPTSGVVGPNVVLVYLDKTKATSCDMADDTRPSAIILLEDP